MKKNIIFAALCGFLALSCAGNKEMDLAPQQPSAKAPGKVVIHATEESATKAEHGTDLTDGSSFRWQAGVDMLSVYKYESEYESWESSGLGYRFVNTTDGEIATFEASPNANAYESELTLSPGDKVTAFYLYGNAELTNVSVGGESRDVLRGALGSVMQIGKNNSEHLTYGDYMFARPLELTASNFDSEGNASITMEFKHIFSKIRFLLKNSTSAPIDVYSVVYRSTCESDIMQGTLYMDLLTGEIVTPDYNEWGDVQPSNSGVLEVKDVTLAPGESTYVWLWSLPLDFSEGNAAGRKADVMVNTSAGVFRVQDIVFNQPFEAGKVYRQGMELTDAKLLSEYAYISDPNFVKMLWEGNEYVDGETGMISYTSCPMYNLDLSPMDAPSSDWEEKQNQLDAITGGRFIKPSEASGITELRVSSMNGNMLCLDGLQYFTGLKYLSLDLGSDMNSPMTLKALRFDTLTQLEMLFIQQSQLRSIDLSHNTKLKVVDLGMEPNMKLVKGLTALSELESFSVQELAEGVSLDFSGLPALKQLYFSTPNPVSLLDLSGLSLEKLDIDIPSMDGVKSDGLSALMLNVFKGQAFPSPVGGVRSLTANIETEPSIASQLSYMDKLDSLELGISGDAVIAFTSAQASLKVIELTCSDATTSPSGWANLSSLEELKLYAYSKAIVDMDLSASRLKKAEINAGSVSGLSIPSADVDELTLNLSKGDVSFTPSGVKKLVITSPGDITLGGSTSLQYLSLEDRTLENNKLVLGSFPNLETLHIFMTAGTKYGFNSVSYASSYPSLKTFSVDGRNIHEVPSAAVFPALENLYITSNTNWVVNGIGSVDLRQYTHLKEFTVGTLNMNYPYTYYNNRYADIYDREYVRSNGAFVLSPEQWEAVKAGGIRLEGYAKYENVKDANGNTCTRHEINSVYGVKDADDKVVDIQDSDGSDGEITKWVYSKTCV
ncbi:MAG: fimbrillin family protein [Bacteroidales bacterium]|nr:fimbrillin family protein [Bacteroidales bacterium]